VLKEIVDSKFLKTEKPICALRCRCGTKLGIILKNSLIFLLAQQDTTTRKGDDHNGQNRSHKLANQGYSPSKSTNLSLSFHSLFLAVFFSGSVLKGE
jgi:hypothetical protein